MNFAHPKLLFLLPIALVVLAIMLVGDWARRRGFRTFGEPTLLDQLVTADAGVRRTFKGSLRILAVVFAIVAVAQPRYGKGTKIIPAADVSAVIALDFSKSMYAQDVAPSRMERARSDVARMMSSLPKIRWGAVAFAGEAVAFPPTTDTPETANFLRAHEPHSMPGGTAIAKALELSRKQLVPHNESKEIPPEPQNSSTKKRQKPVIILVTDGEDLEGDPAAVARAAYNDGIRIHVVLVGGRAPQPIPDIDPNTGTSRGLTRDEQGNLVTTELSPQAENQLRSIAIETKGVFVHAVDGTTGIAQIEHELRSMIASEGGEKVETMFADVFAIPLGIALGLLLLDSFLGEAKRRRKHIQALLTKQGVRS